jgi:hypothetical protein
LIAVYLCLPVRRTDKREQAQEHVATAMYRNEGMTYWPEQAETEQ